MRSPLFALLSSLLFSCGGSPSADAGTDASGIDFGPPSTCDVTGRWSGTAMDVSLVPAVTHTLDVTLTQAGTTLTGTVSRDGAAAAPLTGSIADTSVSFHTGATPPDASTLIYSAAAAPPCTAMSGTWSGFAMAHGPLSLGRAP